MNIDIKVLELMTSIESTSLTTFSKVVHQITQPELLLPILLVIIAYLFVVKKLKNESLLLTTATVLTVILVPLLKNLFQRARPENSLIDVTSFSFPSGHTTTVIVFIGILIYLFANKDTMRKSIAIGVPIILVVIFTRLYLRVHYLTDILGGIVLAGIILYMSVIINKKIVI